jgi:hypothetical protein
MLGGLLEPLIDAQKGFKIYKPTGWNEFGADPGVYLVKYQDIIESETIVQISSSPVKTATSVTALGTVDQVAAKLAKPRNATVVSVGEREVSGYYIYYIEVEGELFHELFALSISNNKLYRVTATTSNQRWRTNKVRKELFRNIILSFIPKGF